ncbi:hypothetical protein [Massilia horti]|uniref:Uncharacterized protein n=1 Tax=Massilia horti TaxID=2562153 RepID=A0A4Y9T8I1_9BURK|nr:hypothetical protein [Massilia horti]TFW36024.1 hypothetical protein E4O92_00700 [Massilia horti]
MEPKKAKLLSLIYLLRAAGVTDKYRTPSAIKELIVLSDAGLLLLEAMKARLPEESENGLYFGFLLDLYHKEFWVDVEQTDVGALIELFDKMFFEGSLRLPWMFGRDLYDNYYRLFTDEKDVLSLQETADLLQKSPQGVAQIGSLIVGPFGIIDSSKTYRPIFPAKKIPLWHCSDTGCEQLHKVELTLSRIPEQRLADEINDAAVELLGERVDWSMKFRETFPHQYNYYNNGNVNDIAAVLTSCLSPVELKTLCAQLLVEHSATMRCHIKMRGPTEALFKNTASVIASKFTREQCLQIVLTLEDKIIIDALEKIIHERLIHIPASETRWPRLGGRGPAGWLGMYSEISQFGFRQLSNSFPDITLAMARLRKMILDFYSDRKIPESTLTHLLRFSQGATVLQKLDQHINSSDPRQVIRDLISIHDKGLAQCLEYLKFGFSPDINCAEDEAVLINKILWKLGFSVAAHATALRTFEARLDALLHSSREITNSSEAERERTRSAAVNLFVSLEELLDLTLSYSSWLFLSDHFGSTRFRFSITEGRIIAARHLSGKKIGSGDRLDLRKDGKNTLFPLIEGLDVLGNHVRALRKKNSKKFLRKVGDEPGYAGKNPLEIFPFIHTLFLYDVSDADIAACTNLLQQASSLLRQGKICEVRNKLEHRREDFPSKEDIERCCDSVSKALKNLVLAGLCPVDYYRVETKIDAYNRRVEIFENYSGHKISVNCYPSHLLSYNSPSDGPIVITPMVHIGDSADVFYADIVSVSEYVEMWKDYPKRRESSSKTGTTALANNGESVNVN